MARRYAITTCAAITLTTASMQESLPDDFLELLEDVPIGQYLVERCGIQFVLWRLTDGEPPDGALEPADDWRLVPA
jgi:hypothetical protein